MFINAYKYAKRKFKKLIKKFFKPIVLRKMMIINERQPRLSNERNNDSWVVEYKGKDLNDIFKNIHNDSKTLLASINKEDKVLIKINLNTADPYPASTDIHTLNNVIQLLKNKGIRNIVVGDCSANTVLPTSNVIRKKKLKNALDKDVSLIAFDKSKWVNVPINGQYLKHIVIPEDVYHADKIIYLANLKTHHLADFTMSMKLAVGFIHPMQREKMHEEHLHEKIAEISLGIQPDLIILDARKPFITLGPNKGEIAEGKTILIGNQLIDVDLKGYKLLYQLKEENNCLSTFTKEPYLMKQFIHAKKIWGGKDESDVSYSKK